MKLLKKIIATVVTFTLMIVTLVTTNIAAEINLNQDTAPPKIKNITVDKKEVKVGDTITITAEVEDESKINFVSIDFEKPMTKNRHGIAME